MQGRDPRRKRDAGPVETGGRWKRAQPLRFTESASRGATHPDEGERDRRGFGGRRRGGPLRELSSTGTMPGSASPAKRRVRGPNPRDAEKPAEKARAEDPGDRAKAPRRTGTVPVSAAAKRIPNSPGDLRELPSHPLDPPPVDAEIVDPHPRGRSHVHCAVRRRVTELEIVAEPATGPADRVQPGVRCRHDLGARHGTDDPLQSAQRAARIPLHGEGRNPVDSPSPGPAAHAIGQKPTERTRRRSRSDSAHDPNPRPTGNSRPALPEPTNPACSIRARLSHRPPALGIPSLPPGQSRIRRRRPRAPPRKSPTSPYAPPKQRPAGPARPFSANRATESFQDTGRRHAQRPFRLPATGGGGSTLQAGHDFVDSRFSEFFPRGVVAESVAERERARELPLRLDDAGLRRPPGDPDGRRADRGRPELPEGAGVRKRVRARVRIPTLDPPRTGGAVPTAWHPFPRFSTLLGSPHRTGSP